MIIKSPMICNKCGNFVKVKTDKTFISLKCKCNCTIHYPSGEVAVVPVEDYKKDFRSDNNG